MGKNNRILIIDDDEDLVEAMKITLESKGYAVLSAFDPEQGFQKAKKEKPNLIILDVMFGREGKSQGFDYPHRMKMDPDLKAIPILMSSAVNEARPNLNFGADPTGEYLPVDDFLDKSAEPAELLKRVEKLLSAGQSIWSDWPQKSPPK